MQTQHIHQTHSVYITSVHVYVIHVYIAHVYVVHVHVVHVYVVHVHVVHVYVVHVHTCMDSPSIGSLSPSYKSITYIRQRSKFNNNNRPQIMGGVSKYNNNYNKIASG